MLTELTDIFPSSTRWNEPRLVRAAGPMGRWAVAPGRPEKLTTVPAGSYSMHHFEIAQSPFLFYFLSKMDSKTG